MATDVEICSVALMRLGDAPIASLADGTKRATICANLYGPAKRDLLRRHTWNCCITRVLLAPLAGAPAYGWSHWFAKPGDWIRTLDVGIDGNDEFVFEGGRILYNGTSLPFRYVAEKSEGNWDSNLTDVMIARMEQDLTYPITKSTSLMETKAQMYRDVLKQAKSIDGQENPPDQLGDSPFVDVRGGGSARG